MIVTELDKGWIRAATVKLLRQGKLKRLRCEVCGARETFYQHTDYSDPEHLKWLCKRHMSEASLSPLQRELLQDALRAFYLTPLDKACPIPGRPPGSFELKSQMTDFEDRQERHRRRSVAGCSIARLVGRGLLESVCRGRWRLTKTGLTLARRLYPALAPPTKRELAPTLALRRAAQHVIAEHPTLFGKRRRRTKSTTAGL